MVGDKDVKALRTTTDKNGHNKIVAEYHPVPKQWGENFGTTRRFCLGRSLLMKFWLGQEVGDTEIAPSESTQNFLSLQFFSLPYQLLSVGMRVVGHGIPVGGENSCTK